VNLLIVFVIAFFSLFQPITPSPDDLAIQAASAYASGNYQEALRLYETLLTEFQSPELYFNLGNTYAKLDEDGYALVNYLRAAEYIPRDQDLRLNIAMIRARRIEPVTAYSGFWESIAQSTKDNVTAAELALVGIVLWWVMWGLYLLKFTRFNRYRLRYPILGIIVALFMVITCMGLVRFVVDTQHPEAVILQDDIQAMSGPGSDYLDLFVLYVADEVRIIQRENGWVRVQQPNLREGWIRADQLGDV